MGDCTVCGRPAGFLKSSHPECAQFVKQLETPLLTAACSGREEHRATAEAAINEAKNSGRLTPARATTLALSSWCDAANLALEDGLLSADEETALMDFARMFGVPHVETPEHAKLLRAAVLRDVREGIVKTRLRIEGNLPFNLLKSEQLVWAFQRVEGFTTRTTRGHQGGSHGFSLRIAKGVYYRPSAFKAASTSVDSQVSLGVGLLGLTNKHLYFAAPGKALRVKWGDVVAFENFSDGVGVNRAKATDRPLLFRTGEGWFTSNRGAALAAQAE